MDRVREVDRRRALWQREDLLTARAYDAKIDAIRTETGVDEYCLLWSIKEYKKVRLEYFTPEWDTWYAKHASVA